ncbi:MAG: MFS transporter [Myxococcales bacterium]|nr:MFS transporter [Myxococcales bacterium]
MSTDAEMPRHSPEYRRRRLLNWVPLGLTYAAFYMGRYNFNVVKGDLGKYYHLDKAQIGAIATAGFWTYAASVMVNGPLTDKLGGRRAILVGAFGAATMNLVVGLLFLRMWASHLVVGMSVLYALCMYFQSFGAVSVVKVNAAWFEVRERGVMGGLFGIFISSGYALAMTLGGKVLGWSKAAFGVGPLAFSSVFLLPAAIIFLLFLVDAKFVQNSPKAAGVAPKIEGEDPAAPDEKVSMRKVLGVVLRHPIIRVIMLAEFCTGFVRQGLLLYNIEFLDEVHHVKVGSSIQSWSGAGITLGGICGGLLCGWMSDRLFDSRRPPVAFIFYLGQIASLIVLGQVKSAGMAAFMIGFSCMWIFGVHGMLSGTASADFGGKKAAATATGLLDGVQYVASGLTGIWLGRLLVKYHWGIWTWSLIPFSAGGALLMLLIWKAKPGADSAH